MARYHLRNKRTGEKPWVERVTLDRARKSLRVFRVYLGPRYNGRGFYLWDTKVGGRVPEQGEMFGGG